MTAISSKTTAVKPKQASEMKAFKEKIEKFRETVRTIVESQKNARQAANVRNYT